jgi:hypothetical protein
MGDVEKIVREEVVKNPNLATWRCKMPLPYYPDKQVEMVLVGMPDDEKPDVPSSLIVFRGYVDQMGMHKRTIFEFEPGEGYVSGSLDAPFEHIKQNLSALRDILHPLPNL